LDQVNTCRIQLSSNLRVPVYCPPHPNTMSPIEFAPQWDFVTMHPGAQEFESCKGADAFCQTYSSPSQWVPAQPCFQSANMWVTTAWPSSEHGAQFGNGFCSMDPSLQPGLQSVNVWVPPLPSAAAPDNNYGQPDLQTPPTHALQPGACSLQGQIWRLARQEQGCRLVQQALEEAASDEERLALVAELHTHVLAALRCPNANHVIQKCIGTLSPARLQFIIDEISGHAAKVAQHKYGCRILQRLLEHCPPEQVCGLLNELLKDALELSVHTYGSYVMKHVLEHGDESHASTLTFVLAEHVSIVCEHSFGCAVLVDALSYASLDARVALANALLLKPDVLAWMARSRHGQLTVKLALQLAEKALPTQRQAALSLLVGQREMLDRSRYGRALSKYVVECLEQY